MQVVAARDTPLTIKGLKKKLQPGETCYGLCAGMIMCTEKDAVRSSYIITNFSNSSMQSGLHADHEDRPCIVHKMLQHQPGLSLNPYLDNILYNVSDKTALAYTTVPSM